MPFIYEVQDWIQAGYKLGLPSHEPLNCPLNLETSINSSERCTESGIIAKQGKVCMPYIETFKSGLKP